MPIALINSNLLFYTVFYSCAADLRFARFVAVEDVVEFFLVGFGGGGDGGKGAVGSPEVGVAAVWVERFGWDSRVLGGGL